MKQKIKNYGWYSDYEYSMPYQKYLLEQRLYWTLLITFSLMCGSFIIVESKKYDKEINMDVRTMDRANSFRKINNRAIQQNKRTDRSSERTTESIKEYVHKETEKEGLKWIDVNAVITCESHWNQYAININRNGTYDAGLYQINSIHKLPNECLFSVECSTKWALDRYKKNPNIWICYKKGLYKKYL